LTPAEISDFAAKLSGTLGKHGAPAGTQRTIAFARTLERSQTGDPADLYWIARVGMLAKIGDLDAFHAAFLEAVNAHADAATLDALVQRAPAPRAQTPEQQRTRNVPGPPSSERSDETEQAETFVAMASPDERLVERDFAEMDERERRLALAAMTRLRIAVELRRSRRRRTAAHGDRLDMRATLRGAARAEGELIRRHRSARRERPRPLVFLCDVSGSMVPYARALLQYARVAALARPRVRAFAFATELTEITPLALRNEARVVMTSFARALADYGGGTRIGAALKSFNDGFAQRGAARGGTVVILSDGWEREDPQLVAREMERLARLSRRVVWVNPQKKHPAFEPLAAGMAAALPYVDAFLTGHNLRSLDAIAEAIEKTLTS
jgi:uncharacterized protein with von Willebrand factor type A (vWA) domain